MNGKKDSETVSKRVRRQIRPARHGLNFYLALFILIFAIPLYIILQFFYADAGGWERSDLFFIIFLLVIAVYGIHTDPSLKKRLPIWFLVLGVISEIVVSFLAYYLR